MAVRASVMYGVRGGGQVGPAKVVIIMVLIVTLVAVTIGTSGRAVHTADNAVVQSKVCSDVANGRGNRDHHDQAPSNIPSLAPFRFIGG